MNIKAQTYSFRARPKIITGLRALESVPWELELYDARSPLILVGKRHARARVTALKRAFAHSPLVVKHICVAEAQFTKQDVHLLLSTLERKQCDSIIAVGSGSLHSMAKVANALYSGGYQLDQLDQLSLRRHGTLPLVSVLTEDVDGREASTLLKFDEYFLRYDQIQPGIAVIDPRLLGRVGAAASSASALISLGQLCESMRAAELSHHSLSWVVPALRLLGDWYQRPGDKEARMAFTNAALLSQIIISNTHSGALWTLSEMLETSGLCSQAEALSALLPHYITMLCSKHNRLISDIISDVRVLSSDSPPSSLWKETANAGAERTLLRLSGKLTEQARYPGTRPIIESLCRQANRLLENGNYTEVQELIAATASGTKASQAWGGRL
ncbi:MAG: iron-containing alcohol dehydrogenase [Spirochaetota bacterium]